MAIDVEARQFSGPIPGENFTSDTKNYPWHRPPEFTDLDSAIEAAFKKLTDDDNSVGILTMLEYGVTVAEVTDMFVTSGIGAGKWTPDFAILLAGPVAHIIYLMAKGYDIDCDLGIERKAEDRPPTKAFFDGQNRINEKMAARGVDPGILEEVQEASADIDEADAVTSGEPPATGFAGMAGPNVMGQPDAPEMEEEV